MSKKIKRFMRSDIFLSKEELENIKEQIKKHYSEVYDGSMDFMNSLNQFKKQAMKITEETRIKDLIPEGYELDDKTGYSAKNAHDLLERYVIIPFKKKEVKDFKWYKAKFIKKSIFHGFSGTILAAFELNMFDSMPFEYKISLLKFICDDIKLPIDSYLSYLHLGYGNIESNTIKNLESICPQEFLNSIFE